MKINRNFLFFIILFFGCEDADEVKVPQPEPVTIFSLSIDTDYLLDKEDYWIMVHDKNGKLLDHEQITTPGLKEFETSETVPDGKIGITIFTSEIINGKSTGMLQSYLSVRTGEVWKWETPGPPPGVGPGIYVGYFTTTFTVADPLRMIFFGNSTTLAALTLSDNKNVRNYSANIHESNKDFLLTVAADGNPRYKFFENVKAGDHFAIDFGDLQEFDKVVNISFPATANPFVSVYSLDEAGKTGFYTYYNGFNIPPFEPSMTLTNLRIGYLNRFEKYYTSVQIPSPNFAFGFEKSGSAPVSISFPDHAPFALTDKSFLTFSYSKEVPFTRRRSSFRKDLPGNVFWWEIIAPEGNDKIVEMPASLLAIYPMGSLGDFKHVSTTFTQSTRTYPGYIDFVGRRVAESKDFETVAITLQ